MSQGFLVRKGLQAVMDRQISWDWDNNDAYLLHPRPNVMNDPSAMAQSCATIDTEALGLPAMRVPLTNCRTVLRNYSSSFCADDLRFEGVTVSDPIVVITCCGEPLTVHDYLGASTSNGNFSIMWLNSVVLSVPLLVPQVDLRDKLSSAIRELELWLK